MRAKSKSGLRVAAQPAVKIDKATANTAQKWQFASRIRPNAFSWKSSRVAVQRIKEALGEINSVARHDPVHAAEGAIRLIERLSPALEHVDSSSGSLGSAVNGAIEALVPLIAAAPVPSKVREKWLERLYEAHEQDGVPYIEILTDSWGELCVTKELANAWADRLLGITRMALSPDKSLRGHYHGTTACLDALLWAERYADLHDVLKTEKFWAYKRWTVKALAAEGKADEAIQFAESSRGQWTSDGDVNRLCEGILLSLGRTDEAYRRYGLQAHRAGTYLATFRAVAKAYPGVARAQILSDLIAATHRFGVASAPLERGLARLYPTHRCARNGAPPCPLFAGGSLAPRSPHRPWRFGLLCSHFIYGRGDRIRNCDIYAPKILEALFFGLIYGLLRRGERREQQREHRRARALNHVPSTPLARLMSA